MSSSAGKTDQAEGWEKFTSLATYSGEDMGKFGLHLVDFVAGLQEKDVAPYTSSWSVTLGKDGDFRAALLQDLQRRLRLRANVAVQTPAGAPSAARNRRRRRNKAGQSVDEEIAAIEAAITAYDAHFAGTVFGAPPSREAWNNRLL